MLFELQLGKVLKLGAPKKSTSETKSDKARHKIGQEKMKIYQPIP